jgi:hypothetical protein
VSRKGELWFSCVFLAVGALALLYCTLRPGDTVSLPTAAALAEREAAPTASGTTIAVRGGHFGKMVDGEFRPMRRVRHAEPLDDDVLHLPLAPPDDLGAFLVPAVLADLDDSLLPTEEGLWLRTVDWWESQEGLFEMTGDELAAMLPDETLYALGGDVSLRDLVGGLPTREDVARGFADPGVYQAFVELCKLDVPLVAMDVEALERQNDREFQAQRQWLRDCTKLLREKLMVELERATGYPHWSFLHRVHSAWMAGPEVPEMETSR